MWVICSLDESRILGRRESKANTFSLWVGGGPGYTAQEDLTFINSYHGGGKDDKGLVFLFLHSKTLLGFFLLFHPWVTTVVMVTQ